MAGGHRGGTGRQTGNHQVPGPARPAGELGFGLRDRTEFREPLWGDPQGLLFFTPEYEGSVATSVIVWGCHSGEVGQELS